MKAVVIGAGNVATHLALAFKAVQVELVQIWSNQYHNATLLAEQVGAQAIPDLSKVDLTADICVLAVNDDAIPAMIDQLIGFKGVVVHTSGSVSIDVFAGKVNRYGVLYPLQTFSKSREVNFSTVPLCIEASDEATLRFINNLAEKLSQKVEEVNSERRKILHLAAVFACNFANHLYTLSAQLLAENELDFDLLRPLILETAEKVQLHNPMEVQTGPAIRGDEKTLTKHNELLVNKPQLLKLYQILSDSIKGMRA